MSKSSKIYYYKDYEEEIVKSSNQNYKLKKDYKWIHTNKIYIFLSEVIYAIAKVFGNIYCSIFLKVKIKNRDILRPYKNTGYFVFGNHTQSIGDVFIPAVVCKDKRIYTVASTANLGIKVIGPLLPMLGILPTENTITGTKELYKAIKQRISEKQAVIIYPEAHVWPYYTKIRPFPNTSFKFPIELNAPVFCMTTTYSKRRFGNKPKITVYVDGPFMVDSKLSKKQNQDNICSQVYECMNKRSQKSNYQYIEYKERK